MASVNPRAHLKWEIPAEVCEVDLKNGERSRRRVRDLMTQLAFEGRSENETERARISMMARSDLLHKGRIQKRKTNHCHSEDSACNARPVHTDGSKSEELRLSLCLPGYP